MKTLFSLIALIFAMTFSYGQTLSVDANGVLNVPKIITYTASGQSFFIGHQSGSSYGYADGIFRAITDNPIGAANVYFDGVTNGVRNFLVTAAGQGYFADNLGIGTTSPTSKLSIAGGDVLLDNARWYLAKSTSGASIPILGIAAENNIYLGDLFGDLPSSRLKFRTGGFDRLTIGTDGNIGIGTTSPDAKLAVNGTIHSTEIKVDLSVPAPDYVFEKNYDLKSLKDIQSYISANKHLPEIPSAKEMETSGINLSEMNMKLLKKVEELTLYLIEQNKRIEQLEAKTKHNN